jgi:hypothetical protein
MGIIKLFKGKYHEINAPSFKMNWKMFAVVQIKLLAPFPRRG